MSAIWVLIDSCDLQLAPGFVLTQTIVAIILCKFAQLAKVANLSPSVHSLVFTSV